LLHYKVPREPSASRVYVWRKLKRIGALLLHDAIWVLPATPRTKEQFQWLAAEISDLEGEAMVWETHLIAGATLSEESLIQQFTLQVDTLYAEILAALESTPTDLAILSRKYQQAQLQDYFHAELGQQVREKLIKVEGGGEEQGGNKKQ
jgi:hypothetical protein